MKKLRTNIDQERGRNVRVEFIERMMVKRQSYFLSKLQ